ncbi:acylphosphatase [Selenomonas timonae]|uniref:Acylphosphatase n=1 Tax=Selenomonas timonae TaxID=2754044 RepID=A0A7G7VKD3_9FIRM|nr:acylphosphatase [Selenomonas timonae]QNH54576.1 acylphosphatase [Selenomonas timonae]
MQALVPGRIWAIALLIFAAFGCFAHTYAAESSRVEETAAIVVGEREIPSIVRARMERTVAAIAAERMEGRVITTVSALEEAEIIGTVFDRLLVGYTVTGVDVRPAQRTEVIIHLAPWADTIQGVHVQMAVEGMPAAVEEIVRADLAGVSTVFSDALVGLPLAATDWATGALKRSLNAYMDEHLPEFRADYDIDVDQTAQVRLTVYPRLPVVRIVDLSMRSDTIPNVTLLTQRRAMETAANRLVGVPVAFVARHCSVFEQQLADSLDGAGGLRRLHLTSQVTITPGERMAVMSRTDTMRYRLRLTGWLDIGRTSENRGWDRRDLHVRLHAGQMLSARDELYAETDAAPEDVRFDWRVGYARELFPHFTGDLRYDLRDDRLSVAGSYALHPRWLVRYEQWTDTGAWEWELRYKMHDFLSVAALADGHDRWLRLIGNF